MTQIQSLERFWNNIRKLSKFIIGRVPETKSGYLGWKEASLLWTSCQKVVFIWQHLNLITSWYLNWKEKGKYENFQRTKVSEGLNSIKMLWIISTNKFNLQNLKKNKRRLRIRRAALFHIQTNLTLLFCQIFWKLRLCF